jgi:branched-chain amino acid transport system ATP-binding protein
MLTVENIETSYGDVQALFGVSLEVREGQIATLVGSNGAGKTTTIRTISGLLKPTRGSIRFLDQEISALSPHVILALGVTQIPEGRRLWPGMTVRENLDLGAYTPMARKKSKDTLDFLFRLFPAIDERQRQLAGTLSGGEQQMVAIARGLMSLPKLLMLDEPSLGLAPIIVEEMFRVITKINQERVTILLVEQNVLKAMEIASVAFVLETGKVIMKGDTRTLLKDSQVKKAYLGL